ncbi:MAG TPA: Hsp33 family molecular chaperone HslO [Alphaproteobacteria bacterium]|nr:Hsp33 family molecular chaperone HslO [Alphaproteobacteria bacterium]
MNALDIPSDDIVLPFQIAPSGLRGRLVRLGPAVDQILRQHDYPAPVATTLAEMVAIAAALAITLKYEGVFTMQIKGDGPVRLMVADVTTEGALRGYAQFDAKAVAALGPDRPSVPRLFGAGHLAFTVDQGSHTERYQGIVELTGSTLAECAHHYFRQSEQFQAGLKVAAAAHPASDGTQRWRAGALMLQRLPPEGAQGSAEGRDLEIPLDAALEDAEESWRRALMLASSATSAELVDPNLLAWQLVDRLYLAEGVRIFRPHEMTHACRCSRERVENVLRMLPADELDTLKIDDRVEVRCEFCNRLHVFDSRDLAALRTQH